MLRNYIKIALRNIRRQKIYSFINIFGLAIGMAATLLILMFVQHELSYDRYHSDADDIYRVSRKWFNNDGEVSLHLGHVAPPFGPLIENDFEGEVIEAVRIISGFGPVIKHNDKSIVEDDFFFADEDIFKVFSWKFIEGRSEGALDEPNTVVITESTAIKYFENTQVVGEFLTFSNFNSEVEMKITGVVEDIPSNSHFNWELMASFSTVEEFFGGEQALMSNWGSNNYATYLLFENQEAANHFKENIPEFIDKHLPQQGSRSPSETTMLEMMPLTDIHLHSHLDSEIEANGDISYIYIFSTIALLTLIIACINFINLSTARSSKRSKEVGLRKVMGAFKIAVVKQFFIESLVLTLVALIIAIGFIFLTLPSFNDFTQKELTINIFQNTQLIVLILGIVLFVGLLAGSYPALYISSFTPVSILRKQYINVKSRFNLRSVLVVIQFAISAALIISVGILSQQLEFMRSKDLGFNEENMMVLPSSQQIYDNWESVRNQLNQHSGIQSASLSSRVPSGRLLDSQGGQYEQGEDMININFRLADIHVDHDFLENYEVPLLSGRFFDDGRASDSTEAFVINNIARVQLGYDSPEEAIGKKMNYGGRNGYIVGVVEDFHFESLHQSIAPIIFFVTSGRNSYISVRYNAEDKDEVTAFLQEQWQYYRSDFPFTSFELSEKFNDQYKAEDRLGSVITYFSFLSIIIAALGLYGLSLFMAERRSKEIGIRKTLGASMQQILVLLGKGFTALTLIAFVLAIPVTYFLMNDWLDNFAYRTEIGLWPFALGIFISVAIAWLTISFQLIKASRVNPIEAMRYE